MPLEQSWLDRVIGSVAPGVQLKRTRARILTDLAVRHYEGAAVGRRTQNWNRTGTDANAALRDTALSTLRNVARDLVRNNPYAESAVRTLADHTVGTGIVARALPAHARATALWKAWAETTVCDADGRHDIYGLQKLVKSTVVESGEAIVRRRLRRPEDGLPIPMQVQVLEPDYLDSGKTMILPNGGYIISGVEYNVLGQRVAYWLFPSHPGSSFLVSGTLLSASRRVPASEVLHVFEVKRAGQVRAASWFAPVVLRMKDFDEFEDATIMKQKVAACLAVLMTDVDGSSPALGTADDDADDGTGTDTLSPAAIVNLPPGRDVTVVDPPRVNDYQAFTQVTLRAIATGLHVAYEDLTGDYTNLPFSAARMSRLRHQRRVNDWRWRMLIPQFCDPVWKWAMEVAALNGLQNPPDVRWTPEPLPFIDPSQEGLAVQRNVRSGIQSLPEAIRERGYDPDELLAEIADFNKKLDELGIVLDTDPRKMSQAGQQQSGDSGLNTGDGQ